MDLLKNLKEFIENQISKLYQDIEKIALDSIKLSKTKEFISNLDSSNLNLNELKEYVQKNKIFEPKIEKINDQIKKIEVFQKFIDIARNSDYIGLNNPELLRYFDETLSKKLKENLNALVKLNKYVNDPMFEDEELKKAVLEIKIEVNNILESNLKDNKKELLKILNNLLQNYSTKNTGRNSANNKYYKQYLDKLVFYKSIFNENQILSSFKSKQEMEEFFEFLKQSSMNEDDIFDLINLFSKYNLDYYNRLKNIKSSLIKKKVDKNIKKATEELENLVQLDQQIDDIKDDFIDAKNLGADNQLDELNQEELEVYNQVKNIITNVNIKGYEDTFYELFKDDFSVENREEYYLDFDEINWEIIKTDFKKILEPNMKLYKEEVFQIFKYIIKVYQGSLEKDKKNLEIKEVIEEKKKQIDEILTNHRAEFLVFTKLNEEARRPWEHYFRFYEQEDQKQLEIYAGILKKSTQYLNFIYILNQFNDLKIYIESILEDKKIEEDALELINVEFEEIFKAYKKLYLGYISFVEKEDSELEDDNELEDESCYKRENFVCILDEEIDVSKKREKSAFTASIKYFKYTEWPKILSSYSYWNTLVYKGHNGKEKDYLDENFIAGRIRRNDYRLGVVVIENICEENKQKLKKRYNLEKIGVIAFVIGFIHVAANHDEYEKLHKFIRNNKNLINEYVSLFKDPATPEKTLFEIIDKGISDCKLLSGDENERGSRVA